MVDNIKFFFCILFLIIVSFSEKSYSINIKKKTINSNLQKNNLVYINGKKFIYENERSPTDYKLNSFCFLAIDAKTGDVLFSKNPNEKCYPASLTKLMTLYILFDNLKQKKLKMSSRIYFSRIASSKQRMKLDIKPGDSISVYEAINALVILSANDVASAVAEKISGSEYNFAKNMTRQARLLGMKSTNFNNPSGLFHPDQKTNAIDLIKLGMAIKSDFPEYYHFFSKTSFIFRGRMIYGHNTITKTYPGAEGLKTGFVKASGYNIVSSVTQNGKTVFAAVLGANSKYERDSYMKNLLDQSFEKISYNKSRNNFHNLQNKILNSKKNLDIKMIKYESRNLKENIGNRKTLSKQIQLY